jgi:hypothetical protein
MSDLPVVRRCVCGHVYEWHWFVGKTGGVIMSTEHGNRCPAWTCDCVKAIWDGADPKRLAAIA